MRAGAEVNMSTTTTTNNNNNRLMLLLTAVLWSVVVFTTPSVSEASESALCPHHFGQKVKLCLEPYWSVAVLFNHEGLGDSVSDVLAKHLCL